MDFGIALDRENLWKNRYGNALPNPETRVKLQHVVQGGSDYINANYVVGVDGTSTRYISAQAPLPATFNDFWLMIYEQKTRVIMMLTKLQEKERAKADVYWPRKGPLSMARGPGKGGENDVSRWKEYGQVSVLLEKTTELEDEITIRSFRIKKEEAAEHSVVQIHYTGWPDFGTPDDTDTFRTLLSLMDKYNNEPILPESSTPASENGPIVLHCSAGLGRTGTLIAAHIASEQLRLGLVKSKEDIKMKKIVKKLRKQRAGMVQTSAQYKYLHALVKDL